MGKYMRKAKHRGKKGMKATLKPTAGGAKARMSHVCYLELRSRKLKKTIQHSSKRRSACRTEEKAFEVDHESNCNGDLDQVAQNFTPDQTPKFGRIRKSSSVGRLSKHCAKKSASTASQLQLQISMDGACISRSSSFSALAPASLCMNTTEATCRKMQTQNHFLGCEDFLTEHCMEMEVSLGDNSTQIDQDRLSLRKSPMILRSRQCSRAATPSSHASTHDKVTTQLITRPVSGTDSDERTADERVPTVALCKTLFGAPSREEIEDFFAEAEQQEHKLFTERYNFDFQNDLPLRGRYDWISLVHS